jgi:hypothetical protein
MELKLENLEQENYISQQEKMVLETRLQQDKMVLEIKL